MGIFIWKILIMCLLGVIFIVMGDAEIAERNRNGSTTNSKTTE